MEARRGTCALALFRDAVPQHRVVYARISSRVGSKSSWLGSFGACGHKRSVSLVSCSSRLDVDGWWWLRGASSLDNAAAHPAAASRKRQRARSTCGTRGAAVFAQTLMWFIAGGRVRIISASRVASRVINIAPCASKQNAQRSAVAARTCGSTSRLHRAPQHGFRGYPLLTNIYHQQHVAR